MELEDVHVIANSHQLQSNGMEMGGNCLVYRITPDLAECMVAGCLCQWKYPYGNSEFCMHPLVKQFAELHPAR
ncbi:MAG: hypothetical protein PHT15_05670 [Gallionellaceae bacterium]|nr:hypothetical protein [Gallionellaceae bacterium]